MKQEGNHYFSSPQLRASLPPSCQHLNLHVKEHVSRPPFLCFLVFLFIPCTSPLGCCSFPNTCFLQGVPSGLRDIRHGGKDADSEGPEPGEAASGPPPGEPGRDPWTLLGGLQTIPQRAGRVTLAARTRSLWLDHHGPDGSLNFLRRESQSPTSSMWHWESATDRQTRLDILNTVRIAGLNPILQHSSPTSISTQKGSSVVYVCGTTTVFDFDRAFFYTFMFFASEVKLLFKLVFYKITARTCCPY